MSKQVYNPLHLHTHYSTLDGLSQPKKIADYLYKQGISTCAVTDHGVVSGSIKIENAFKKRNIKPIFGCELYLSQFHSNIKEKTNSSLAHLCVLAKNKNGWKDMLKIISESNRKDNFYRKPRLSRGQLMEYAKGNFISFSGHCGSELANILFKDPKLCYRAKTVGEAHSFLKPTALEEAVVLAKEYEGIFGKGNFFIEIQLVDGVNLPAVYVIADILREVSVVTGIPCVATADSHYITQQDAIDQRVLLASSLQTTIPKVENSLAKNEDVSLGGFFKSNRYHIPTNEEMAELHKDYPEELENSLMIGEMCEKYSIMSDPLLPSFITPNGFTQDSYLKHLCDTGWKDKIEGKISFDKLDEYQSRLDMELNVMQTVGLSSYFLIVHDYVQAARNRGEWVGVGRGSAGGCFIAYLLNIIKIDPIENDCQFERFFNVGRLTPGKISLPDVDIDYEVFKRDNTKEHIRNLYGPDKVSQVVTFSKMMGKGVLKEVLRINEACNFEEMGKITKHIPHEASISDALEHMRENAEEGEEVSIIRWALENNSKELSDYCVLEDDGNLSGPYANYFAQAMRLESTVKSSSKHASALLVSKLPLDEVCPMVYDKSSDNLICGFDGVDAESAGLVKFDILGTKILDKMHRVSELVAGRKYV